MQVREYFIRLFKDIDLLNKYKIVVILLIFYILFEYICIRIIFYICYIVICYNCDQNV